MNINDVMIRDMADAERHREEDGYDREIRRRIRRRRWRVVGETIGYIAVLAFLVAFCWLCCAGSGYHWE